MKSKINKIYCNCCDELAVESMPKDYGQHIITCEKGCFKKQPIPYLSNYIEVSAIEKCIHFKKQAAINEAERKVKYPAIYRHFKNKLYATISISKPLPKDDLDKMIYRFAEDGLVGWWHYAEHTEDKRSITVFYNKETDTWHHSKDDAKEELVLYKSLYDGTGIYARPKDIFLSKVDKEKYPDVKQVYRFELEEKINEE